MKAWFVHNVFGRTYKVNTTKYIKMVSITSIETKLVQKKPNTIAQTVALRS